MLVTKSFIEKRYASKVIYENFIIVLKNEIIIKDNSLSDLFSYNSRDIYLQIQLAHIPHQTLMA